MKTHLHRRRLIRSPRDRRRGGTLAHRGALALAGVLGVATVACDPGVQETTRSTAASTTASRGDAPAVPAQPPVGRDPASAPLHPAERTQGGGAAVSLPDPVTWDTAEAAWRGRDYARAVLLFTAWTAERPRNPWGHYMVGLSHWKAGELDPAEDALLRAVELDGEHRRAHLNLARVRLEAGRADDALEPALRAAELEPGHPEAWRVLGRVHHERGATDDAISAYQTALFLDREDAWSLNNLGLLLIQRGRFEEALGPLARAVEVDGTLAVAHNNLGVALERTGRNRMAAEAYSRAVELGEGGKAAVSLARVEGRPDGPDAEPVTLSVLAGRFEPSQEPAQPGRPVAVQPREP